MKCKPNNLQFETQSVLGKTLVYHDDVSIEEMLNGPFWRNIAGNDPGSRIKVGDRIVLMQVEYKNFARLELQGVLRYVETIVSGFSDNAVEKGYILTPTSDIIEAEVPVDDDQKDRAA